MFQVSLREMCILPFSGEVVYRCQLQAYLGDIVGSVPDHHHNTNIAIMQVTKSFGFLKKLIIDLLYDPAIPLLGIYPKDLKTHIQKDSCTLMFIAELFMMARTWKQPTG